MDSASSGSKQQKMNKIHYYLYNSNHLPVNSQKMDSRDLESAHCIFPKKSIYR